MRPDESNYIGQESAAYLAFYDAIFHPVLSTVICIVLYCLFSLIIMVVGTARYGFSEITLTTFIVRFFYTLLIVLSYRESTIRPPSSHPLS